MTETEAGDSDAAAEAAALFRASESTAVPSAPDVTSNPVPVPLSAMLALRATALSEGMSEAA